MASVANVPNLTNWNVASAVASSGVLMWTDRIWGQNRLAGNKPRIVAACVKDSYGFLLVVACSQKFSFGHHVSNSSDPFDTYNVNGNNFSVNGYSYVISYNSRSGITFEYGFYSTQNEARAALNAAMLPQYKAVTYRLTNCTGSPTPAQAEIGTTLSIALTPSNGFAFLEPTADIYVTNNGTRIQSTFSNGTLSFVVPE